MPVYKKEGLETSRYLKTQLDNMSQDENHVKLIGWYGMGSGHCLQKEVIRGCGETLVGGKSVVERKHLQ